jgi:DNA adenine methylase
MVRYDRPHTLFYLDPPYWETEGYGVDFPLSEYERLADLMGKLKGKAILSLNDHPDIRRIFGAFQMDVTDIRYTVGGGGRSVERQEVIIYSWDKQRSGRPVLMKRECADVCTLPHFFLPARQAWNV